MMDKLKEAESGDLGCGKGVILGCGKSVILERKRSQVTQSESV